MHKIKRNRQTAAQSDEESITLSPLSPEQALRGLLAVKPPGSPKRITGTKTERAQTKKKPGTQ
jgi:hypothetical protein